MPKNRITVIEFTERYLKLLDGILSKDVFRVACCEAILISKLQGYEISEALKDAVRLKRVSSKQAAVIIPRSCVTLKDILLPSHDPREIKSMLDLQVAQLTPYSKDDILFDWIKLEKLPSGQTKILLIIVRKNIIDKYLQILKHAGLMPTVITISSLGIVNWFSKFGNKVKPCGNSLEILVHLDDFEAEVCFCHDGKLLFSRSLPAGEEGIPGKDYDEFMNQIKVSFDLYQSGGDSEKARRITVLSSQENSDAVRECIKERYGTAVDSMDPLVEFGSHRHILPARFLRNGLSYTAALGLTFYNGLSVNLLPYEDQKRHKKEIKKHKRNELALLAALTFLLALSLPGIRMLQKTGYLNDLHKRIGLTQTRTAQARAAIARFYFLEGHMTSKILVADIFSELYRLTPHDIAFESLELGDEKGFILRGISRTDTDVNRFHEAMIRSEIFQNVSLEYVKKREKRDGRLIQFEIKCRIKNKESL